MTTITNPTILTDILTASSIGKNLPAALLRIDNETVPPKDNFSSIMAGHRIYERYKGRSKIVELDIHIHGGVIKIYKKSIFTFGPPKKDYFELSIQELKLLKAKFDKKQVVSESVELVT